MLAAIDRKEDHLMGCAEAKKNRQFPNTEVEPLPKATKKMNRTCKII